MHWSRRRSLALFIFVVVCNHYVHTKSVESLHTSHSSHHPSLSIAGDPKDVKLKASIDQLVRALQYQEPKKQPEAKSVRRRITSSDLITKHSRSRNLYYGDAPQAIPDPITVSSQPIQITGANGTKGKRARSMSTIDEDGVKTIEGIRVPDDEHDKHYTWRNARVIKGFLVPNDRSAQPHRKRQIVYSDSSRHYLASLAQNQGATLIDSAGYQPQAQAQSAQNIVYTPAQPQATQYIQQDLGGATIYTANNQYQQSGPASATILTAAQNAQAAYPQYQQQQGQMYVLQEGTNTYVPYNPVQLSQTHESQSQFSSRTGEASPPQTQTQAQTPLSTAEQQQQQQQLYQQQVQQYQQQQQQQQAAIEAAQAEAHAQAQAAHQAHAQQAQVVQQAQASQHVQVVQQPAPASAVAPQESQRQQPVAQQPQPQQAQSAPAQQAVLVQQQQQQPSQLQAQQQAIQIQQQLQQQQQQQQQLQQQQQQQQQQQAVVFPQGTTLIQARIDQQPQESTAQIYHIQQQPGQTVYQIQNPASTQYSERQSVYQQSPSSFVIQPQTYVTGPGGSMFTVPIPVPADQALEQQQHQQQHRDREQHQLQQREREQQHRQEQHHHHQQQQQHNAQNAKLRHDLSQHKDKNSSDNLREKFSLANKIMQSFQFNRKTMETVERNAVVPALASTGLFLGLGALAAGWYLSKANREVGIVRRSGRPAGPGALPVPQISSYNPQLAAAVGATGPAAPPVVAATPATTGRKRSRRSPQTHEVDQATFFQSIIQQSLEKQQQKLEDVRPVYSPPPTQEPYREAHERHEYESESSHRPKHAHRNDRGHSKYSSRDEDDYFTNTSPNSKVSKQHYAQEKSGWSLGSAKNFAKVAIPAVILGGAIIGMAALIFGWYISGTNREIAFLEPAAYSRRKRSLMSSTALSDGWLQRVLTSIHGNPYDNLSHEAFDRKSVIPHPLLEKETSKTSDLEFKISNGGLAGVLAGGAILALGLGFLASSFSETSRQLNSGSMSASNIFGGYNNKYPSSHSVSTNSRHHIRVPRSILTNELNVGLEESPGFLGTILQNLEVSQSSILNKLQEVGYTKWQETPCAKRIFCDVMSAQSEDTVRLMEKKLATIINMLPASMSNPLSKTLGGLIGAISRRDCSPYSCGGHWVDPSIVDQPSPPANQPR